MDDVRLTIVNDEKFLRQVSVPVSFKNDDYKKDIELIEQNIINLEVLALAAIQIGIPKRIIYVKSTSLKESLEDSNYNEAKVYINPVIISRIGHTKFLEACYSCLDASGVVSRPYKMTIKYHDINGKKRQKTFKGLETTIMAHELDHLDGNLHIDIAEKIEDMTVEERVAFRKDNPYEIISKTCDYEKVLKKIKKLMNIN